MLAHDEPIKMGFMLAKINKKDLVFIQESTAKSLQTYRGVAGNGGWRRFTPELLRVFSAHAATPR